MEGSDIDELRAILQKSKEEEEELTEECQLLIDILLRKYSRNVHDIETLKVPSSGSAKRKRSSIGAASTPKEPAATNAPLLPVVVPSSLPLSHVTVSDTLIPVPVMAEPLYYSSSVPITSETTQLDLAEIEAFASEL